MLAKPWGLSKHLNWTQRVLLPASAQYGLNALQQNTQAAWAVALNCSGRTSQKFLKVCKKRHLKKKNGTHWFEMFLLSQIWWDFSRRWHNWVKSNQCSVSLPFWTARHAAPWRILKTVCLIQKCLNNYKWFRLEKDSFWHGMPVQIIALEVIYSLKITDTGLTLLPKPLGMGGWVFASSF